jgi:hypothetical protein
MTADEDTRPSKEKPSKLRERFQQHQRELLSQAQPKEDEEDKHSSLLQRMSDPQPERPKEAAGGPVAATPRVRSVPQIVGRYLPLTRQLPALLHREPIRLSDFPEFNPVQFDTHFRTVGSIVSQLEEQFKNNDDADHPQLPAAADTLLNDKFTTARYLLELLGYLKHGRGDNYQTWENWDEPQKNAATAVLYQYVRGFDQVRAPTAEPHESVAHAIAEFITYATPSTFLLQKQRPRYYAIRLILYKAVRLSSLSTADPDAALE